MKVTVIVGQTTREVEVRDDLMHSRFSDRAQDTAVHKVGRAFTDAYIAEVNRAEEAASGRPAAGNTRG
jgi:hypothetical protein